MFLSKATLFGIQMTGKTSVYEIIVSIFSPTLLVKF